MYNINGKQLIAIVGAVVSVLMVSTAQLTDLLGPTEAKTIVTVAGLLNMLLQSITVALSTQTSQVKDVLAMPGIEKISVNSQASQALATIAVDPASNKIAPTQAAMVDVTKTAQGIAS
jgi:hypothetical protein